MTEAITTRSKGSLLLLDDEPTTVAVLRRLLEAQRHEVLPATSVQQANSHMAAVIPDLLIVDVFLKGEDGLEWVREMRRKHRELGIVMISAEDTDSLAQKAINSGADYFLSKPISPNALLLTVQKLLELRRERTRASELENELQRATRQSLFPDIVTHSDSMKSVLRLIEKVSPRDLSVLVFGESGTGKELVARAIHNTSKRSSGAFVELNCAALPPNLVESELFGHEKGAFTGAISTRPGKMEIAHNGTLFLDEIGELPLEIQPKLLRALQEKRIVRVGGKTPIDCDFRLVSATHRDLLQEVREGRFREDLFYRVAVFPIKLPPLRDRLEDLDLLLAHFLRQDGVTQPTITPGAMAMLRAYNWPGNIRELKNFTQAITLLSDQEVIDEAAVTAYFGTRMAYFSMPGPAGAPAHQPALAPQSGCTRPVRRLEDIEREEIEYALRHYKGNVPEAALALGMGRATLYKYIKKAEFDLAKLA
jgi:DNA-binding NtrC family response regulator